MKSDRLLSLPPYLFEELENQYNSARSAGRDVIDVSVGDPDIAPPASLLEATRKALDKPEHHRYPPQRGYPPLKAAIRRYMKRRCGVEPADNEILILIGSKEGIGHLALSVCNPGDLALVPTPGYPVYASSSGFAGCEVREFNLRAENNFRPDFDELERPARTTPRLLFLNYPNNPTSATVGEEVFDRALAWSDSHGSVVVNDAAYADVFAGSAPPLLMGRPSALERSAVEFFSFSKSLSVTGWRVGFAVGRSDVIDALAHLKANLDSGVFGAIQDATATVLDGDGDRYMEDMRKVYQQRREVTVTGLEKLGFECLPSYATFYVWVRLPAGGSSMDYALSVLDNADVLLTPGVGFGRGGEGYFRIALTQPAARLEEAVSRIERIS